MLKKREISILETITVGSDDINEMLDRYDSGMSDRTTCNAISLAIQRMLKKGHQVRMFSDRSGDNHFCRIDDHEFPLPNRLSSWLSAAECGIPVEPVSFEIPIPKTWLLAISTEKEEIPERTETTSRHSFRMAF